MKPVSKRILPVLCAPVALAMKLIAPKRIDCLRSSSLFYQNKEGLLVQDASAAQGEYHHETIFS
jgi:hypothetical protein